MGQYGAVRGVLEALNKAITIVCITQ